MLSLARHSSRAFGAVSLALALVTPFAISPRPSGAAESEGAESSVALIPAKKSPPTRVKVIFEVDGQLLTEASKEQGSARELELKARGQFLYEERRSDEARGTALRYYEQADAEIAVEGRPSQVELRDDRRFIAVDAAPRIRSLQGALTRAELELIELPGGSHLIDQLLPNQTVRVGETWTHDDALLAQLLNLSAVTANEVTSELKSIDRREQTAQLVISGKLIGAAAGVVTEVDLQGKYRFDLQRQRVTWLALGVEEQRATGLTKPGLRVEARVRMLIEECLPEHLSADSLKTLLAAAPQPTDLLEFQPRHGRFTLMHDRRWHVYSEHADLIVFRMIEDEQLIAQCNLRSLPSQGEGQAVSLDQFQQEIRTALGSAAQQVVDRQESMQANGVRQLRVSLAGQVANAPIHWVYYQLTDPSRQNLTCVFTMSGENVDHFAAEDVTFVSSLTLNPPESQDEAPAKEVARRVTSGG